MAFSGERSSFMSEAKPNTGTLYFKYEVNPRMGIIGESVRKSLVEAILFIMTQKYSHTDLQSDLKQN